MLHQATTVYFSPGKTTAAIAKQVTASLGYGKPKETIDLLAQHHIQDHFFDETDVLVVAMPVFAGRVPAVCVDRLQQLKANGTPAVAVVVYGNREYEDALLELTDILKANGFIMAGAAAFVARHSIFTKVAQGRPDENDKLKINDFAENCSATIGSNEYSELMIPGNHPYKDGSVIPLHPSANHKCNSCGTCAKLCPVGAIPADNPRLTDGTRCISCTACIYHCPQNARKIRGLKFRIGAKAFAKKNAARKEPSIFTAQ